MFKESMPSPEKLKKLAEKAKKQTERGMEHLAGLSEEELEKIKKKYEFEASEEEKGKAEEEKDFWEKKKKGE